jgi:hypothetical protein
MTIYSPTSEIPPKPLSPLTTEDYQLDDWESKMARLVGLEEESLDFNRPSLVEQPSPVTPQEAQTEQPLASNPFAKLALVATATLAIVLVAGVFLSQMMSANNQKPKPIVASPTPSPIANLSSEQNLQQEIETLKTKLALAEQAQAVKRAQQNLRNATTTSVRPTVKPIAQNNSGATTDRLSAQPAPRTVIVERVAANPYLPPPIPVANAAIPQLPPPPPVQATTALPTPNPFAEWSRLAKLGSYGEVNIGDAPRVTASVPAPENNSDVPPQSENPRTSSPPQTTAPVISQATYQSPKSLKVGTSAKAVLATAVFGETTRGNDNNNDNPNMFVVQLREPLKDLDGAIALPAKTELLTQVISISEQGLVQLKIVKVILQNNGNLTERDVPENALLIRASRGRPLVAQQYPNRSSSIASMDAGLFVLGGIAKAAELYNRTDSQVTVNGGSTVVTNDSNRRNILAGVVEGGLTSLVPQISQRNQQAIAQMMQQTNVWLLSAGSEVEIYVNQSMQF